MSEQTEVKPPKRRNTGEVVYEGKYVIVKKKKAGLKAQLVNDPYTAPAEILVRALKELKEKRDEIKHSGIIWISGFGFDVGIVDNGNMVIKPAYGKKAILLSNVVKFVKYIEKAELLKLE